MDDTGAQSSQFLVEVTVNGSPAYIVCTRAGGPFNPDAVPGLPQAELQSMFQQGALRAVALPRTDAATVKPMTFAAFAAQSGRDLGDG